MDNSQIRLECLKLAQDASTSERVSLAATYTDFVISGKSGETPERPAAKKEKE